MEEAVFFVLRPSLFVIRHSVIRSFFTGRSAQDSGEDEVEFLGFPPEYSGLGLKLRHGSDDHVELEFGLPGLLQVPIFLRNSLRE